MILCYSSARLIPTSLLLAAFSASPTKFTVLAPSTDEAPSDTWPLAFSQTPESQRRNEDVIPQAEASPTHYVTH